MADQSPPSPISPRQIRLFTSDRERRRQLRVANARPAGLKDLYHHLLRTSWALLFLWAALAYVAINALFGVAYWQLGGVSHVEGYLDAFFFAVQTFGTIGYGVMAPETVPAHVLVTFQAFLSLFVNAMVTGLAFAKFARPTARVLWTNKAVICDRDGVPTLMFRVANERRNHVVEATIRAAVIRAERTKEGETLRRVVDLQLLRSSSPTFILTWTVMHQITPSSPLYGMTPEKLAEAQMEVVLTLTGLDETLGQTIHDRTSFLPTEVLFAQRFGDMILVDGTGGRVLDYAHFHDTKDAPLTLSAMGVGASKSSDADGALAEVGGRQVDVDAHRPT